MCGIAGIMNLDGTLPDEKILHTMADAMIRRGPDGEGFFQSGSMALAHRRLAVIDLKTGAQPLLNEDETIAAVVNGEIYNFQSLRAELVSKGHVFRTNSDSEVALHLYEEYGTSFSEHLKGMFAVAVCDTKKRRIVLTRDRAGEKPIVYFRTGKVFAFASELNALKKHPEMPRETDFRSLYDYLSLSYIPSPRTIYSGVSKLPPAHTLEISMDFPVEKLSCYWKVDYEHKTLLSYSETLESLRFFLKDSVRQKLVSDVPLGIFLSGGLDSALIAGLASRECSSETLNCFSIGFPDSAYDESVQAESSAKWLAEHAERKVEFHLKTVNPEDFSVVREMSLRAGEPFADSSLIPTFLLCKFAREHVTVALGGDGADELFGGYERYVAMNLLRKIDFLPLFCRKALFGTMEKYFSRSGGERTFPARFARFLQAAALSTEKRYASLLSACSDDWKHALFSFVPESFEETSDMLGRIFGALSGKTVPDRVMELDFKTYLSGDILMKTDLASMSNSLELRAPFLDRRVMELAFSIPHRWKIEGTLRKRILGDAFRGVYPEGLDRAKKRGFGVPVSAWFRGPWKKELEDTLNGGVLRRSLFRRDVVEKMVSDHVSGKADHGRLLYTLLILELFMEGEEH